MEKISFQATYTRISIYASSASGAGKAVDKAGTGKAPDPSDGGKDGHGSVQQGSVQQGSAGAYQRNKDGDTFTLSIEARSIQISGTLIIDDSGKALSDASAWKGRDAETFGAEYLEGLGLPSDARMVNAFLDAMRKYREGGDGHDGRGRQHHFPRLGDAEDLAERLLEHLGRQQAETGGSRAELADGVRRRLNDWATPASKAAVEFREFRGEVRMKMNYGLDAWVASEADAANNGVSQVTLEPS